MGTFQRKLPGSDEDDTPRHLPRDGTADGVSPGHPAHYLLSERSPCLVTEAQEAGEHLFTQKDQPHCWLHRLREQRIQHEADARMVFSYGTDCLAD